MNNVNLPRKYVTKRMQYWYWLMEEFGLKYIYLKGSANNLADTLSWLDTGKDVTEVLCILDTTEVASTMHNDTLQAEVFNSVADENIPENAYPLST